MTTVWREVDRGWNVLVSTMRAFRAQKPHVKVGVLAGDGDGGAQREGGITNAELAAVMEYGTSDGRIPARSFVGSTINANKDKYYAWVQTLLARVYEGRLSGERLLQLLGLRAASDIKLAVTQGDGIPPPNAESTTRRKKSDRPLIDTGRLINSVSWLVVLTGGGDDGSS